jgi:hypothetical protein
VVWVVGLIAAKFGLQCTCYDGTMSGCVWTDSMHPTVSVMASHHKRLQATTG